MTTSALAPEARIPLHGPFEAHTADGTTLSVTGLDIAREGYVADVFVRLAQPYVGALYDDSTFVAYVRNALRSVGYTGPGFERAESGMQGKDFIVLEPNRSFAAFARSKGWTDLGLLERAWTAQPGEVTQPEVRMQEVTFTFHLRARDRSFLFDSDYKKYSAYMDVVEKMLQDDVRAIPGWVVTDEHDVECETYQFCDPEGHYSGSGVDEVGPYEYFELQLPIQARRAWTAEEVQRIAQALRETLNKVMDGYHLDARLHEVRSYSKFEHVERAVLFQPVTSAEETL